MDLSAEICPSPLKIKVVWPWPRSTNQQQGNIQWLEGATLDIHMVNGHVLKKLKNRPPQ